MSSLNRKITSNKTKHVPVENELKKLKTFDSSYFIGKSHFEEDGVQNYLVFQPLNNVKTHPKLVNCLFGAVSVTKNADIEKNKHSGYRIGFDRTGVYLLPDGSFGRNVVIFGVDMNLSVHVDNNGKDILILGKGPTQGLGEHSITAEKMCSVSFTDHRKKCCLSLHYNGANSYLFVNGTEIIKFKAKKILILLQLRYVWETF